MNDSILILEPCVKNYDWGNDYFIADLLEQEKNGPRAEMWIGAHRLGSAVVKSSGEKLCDFLDSNPGFASCDADSFPYLLKILAIAQSLSIQCHPDAEQAREGFEAEKPKHERIDRKDWNYQDPNPKAEMFYALTPITAMCGFRSFEEASELLKTAIPVFYSDHISEVGSVFELFDKLYRMDEDLRSFAQAELLKNCDLLPPDVRAVVRELCDRFFGDPGVFCPLLLNIVHLEPGQAVYLKPRVLHAYVSGNGVELMNNSDNVLRAGLTSKHMDLDELEKVMLHESYLPKPMDCYADEGGVHFVCEGGFTLTVMQNGTFRNRIGGPKTLLCTEGSAMVNEVLLQKGQCCIAGSSVGELIVTADGATVFMASDNN
ncbi:MAG: mannose-6-phosphate isomerase, class I [Spirochaetales bacterium]|nr:mannose-6-phosphate isomerase, class I [Spirochaetales bacterium]